MAEMMRGLTALCCACVLLLLLASVHTAAAATVYQVKNLAADTPGGQRFNSELGAEPMKMVLSNAASFIQGVFSLSTPKDVPTLTLVVESFSGVAYTGGNKIHLSANYVEQFQPGNTRALKSEITGVLYHESAHVWQNNNGNYGSDPYFTGIIEGMEDVIRLRSGFPNSSWVRQRGGNWYSGYSGYSTTAYFLQWIEETQKPNFVNELNKKMATPWSNDFFLQIVGRDVDKLWQEYQNSL